MQFEEVERLAASRRPDRSGDASRRVARKKQPGSSHEKDSYSPAFLCRVPDECGPHGSSARIPRAASSDAIHSLHDVIQQVSPATLNPAFRHTILPRALKRSSDRSHVQGPDCGRNLKPVFAVSVKDQESGSRSERECFAELLNNPQISNVASGRDLKTPGVC
jgi:hypothetical protein